MTHQIGVESRVGDYLWCERCQGWVGRYDRWGECFGVEQNQQVSPVRDSEWLLGGGQAFVGAPVSQPLNYAAAVKQNADVAAARQLTPYEQIRARLTKEAVEMYNALGKLETIELKQNAASYAEMLHAAAKVIGEQADRIKVLEGQAATWAEGTKKLREQQQRSVDDFAKLQDENKRLRVTITRQDEERVGQLVAISTAAFSNTRWTARKNRIERSNPFWTAAYEDVRAAVEREMRLREQVERLQLESLRDEDSRTDWGV